MKNSLCHRFKVKTFAAAALLAALECNRVRTKTWSGNPRG